MNVIPDPAEFAAEKKEPAAAVWNPVLVLEPRSTGPIARIPKLLSSVSVAPVVVPTLSNVKPAQSVVVVPVGTANPVRGSR